MKLTRINFKCIDEYGKKYSRTLEGEEAEKWSEYMLQVCLLADKHDLNPDWASLGWKVREINSKEKVIKK